MKAGIYLGKGAVEIREFELPEVGDNDVLVQNIYSSICGTDVAVFTHGLNTGHKIDVGGEFGHETVSRVVKVGKMSQSLCREIGCIPTHAMQKTIPSVQERLADFQNIF